MGSVNYYVIFGTLAVLLQKDWKRALYVSLFFLLILLAPTARELIGANAVYYYAFLNLGWYTMFYWLEENKIKVFAMTMFLLTPYVLGVSPLLQLILIELSIIVFFCDTKIKEYINCIDVKVNKLMNKIKGE